MDLPSAERRSFFVRFKKRLQQEGSDPGGRYFSVLLEQVFYEIPEVLCKSLFPTCRKGQFRHARVETDFQYAPRRFADLAFFDLEDRTIGLVEVKEEDQLGPGTGDQTHDYLTYIKKNSTEKRPIHFAYVTKHLPSDRSSLALRDAQLRPIYYSDLHNDLVKYLAEPQQRQRSPVTQLFCRYLQEEGVVYQPISSEDENTLRLLLRQGLGMRGGKKDVTAERQMQVPTLLGTLLANVQAMGVEFHNRFKNELGNRFVPRFSFYPLWRKNNLLKDPKDEDDWLDSDRCDGGTLYLWSEGLLKSRHLCYVWLGYKFEFNLNERVTKHLYAGVGVGHGDRSFDDCSAAFKTFPDYGKAQKGARTIIRNQIREATKSGKAPGGERLVSLGRALDKF